ncbi:MAG: hypothetical protein EPO24_12960, partial [Bacteroidetes bacterium]
LRSPEWPDPTADRGKHSIEYSLYPHQGRVLQGATIQRGYEYNTPLIGLIGSPGKGKLPMTHSFISLSPQNLILTSVKQAEDSNAWILQWYETQGIETQAVLTLPLQPKSVVRSNVLEEDGMAATSVKNVVNITTDKNSITTIKVLY